MKVSVIFPTRERVDRLHTMLSTLYATASSLENVEVIARVDVDDQSTINYLHSRPQVKRICKERVGYAKNAQMVNECAALSTGDLLLVANDDLVFETQDWDAKLADVAAGYPDGVYSLCVDTVLNNKNCCFPCISRTVMDALGFFFDDRLLYGDIWMRDVMQPLGRVVRVPQVVIRHAWAGMTEDQAQAINNTVRKRGYQELYDQCVNEAREKVAKLMEVAA